jgi:hypothetical protein
MGFNSGFKGLIYYFLFYSYYICFSLYISVGYTSSNFKCVWKLYSMCYFIVLTFSIHKKGFSSQNRKQGTCILCGIFFRCRKSPTGAKAVFLLRFLHHTRLDTHTSKDSSCGMNILSQRPLPTQHTTNTTDGHAFPQLDSNPQYQQSSGFKFTP